MSDRPGRTAVRAALADWRRHLVAVAMVTAAVAVAEFGFGTSSARYGAVLVAFAVWMAWFVLTAVAWIRHADF